MDSQAICQGFATAASTVDGLSALPYFPDSVGANVPLFAPLDWSIEYDQTFGASSLVMIQFTLQLVVSRTGDSMNGRKLLARYADTNVIKSAIEADRTLGGACATLIVDRAKGIARYYTVGTDEYMGCQFDARVWTV